MHIPRILTRTFLSCALLSALAIPSLAAEGEYTFTRSDFEGESGVVITAIPSAQTGLLRCGSRTIQNGDVLTVEMLDSLSFLAADTNRDAAVEISYLPVFGTSVDAEQTVRLELLAKKKNQPPTVEDSEFETYRNISNSGTLQANDPENKPLTYTVTKQPRRGSVSIAEDGTFTYTPEKNKVGKDTFEYTVTDSEGLTSDPATVSIRVKKPSEKDVFSDMKGSDDEYYAVWAREQGLLSGELVAGTLCFRPNATVTRGEFVVMVMNLFDLELRETLSATGFADEAATPTWMQPYLLSAVSSGIVSGIRSDTGLVFRANSAITEAEAAVILQNLLQFPAGKTRSGTAEVWAEQAVAALSQAGVQTLTGSAEPLTRIACAKALHSAYHASDSGRYGLLAWAAD
ncbi:MAG: S-layer homology domain-containing protein [Ruminococcaceae bacterium]|nr:S-layer homology domain-containing protein [Oscillospiraceae bacterium]